MDLTELQKKIAYLEFVNDQLESEIEYLDSLFREAGFADGLITLKNATIEAIEEENSEN